MSLKIASDSKSTEEQLKVHRNLRAAFETAEQALETLPASREKALALTNLEQALMWAGKAIYNA